MIKATPITELDVQLIIDALTGSLNYLEQNYKLLDNLNVFPVPDGDTGVNMLLTIKPSVEGLLNKKSDSNHDLFIQFNRDITNHSRGNSGFILSRFFNGFSKSIIAGQKVNSEILKKAFMNGAYDAKSSLMNPVEGTMITIISEISNCMLEMDETDIVTLLSKAVDRANEVLFKTPEMLPTLAKAGVIDSGALGFIFIMRGMLQGITHSELTLENEEQYRFEPDGSIVDDSDTLQFKYCTELIAENVKDFPIDKFKSFLKEKGDSIAVLYEKELLKVHIHTNEPELIINTVNESGTVTKQKIEDMEQQVSIKNSTAEEDEFSILSIVPGDGFIDVFSDLGVEHFLIYDNLPSVIDVLNKVDLIEHEHIILLPNDKNIIPVALQVQKKSDKNIAVVLSKNIVQGISALYGFNEFESLNNNIESMNENIDLSICIKVNISTMDVQYGNVSIKENDFFITMGDDVLSTGESFSTVLLESLKSFNMEERANITFYYNDTMDVKMLEAAKNDISKLYGDIETEIQYGGQKKSAVIIAIE